MLKERFRSGVNFLLASLLTILTCSQAFSQAPQLVNYQAVARNSSTGQEIANERLFVIVKVRSGSDAGTIIYQEEHADLNTDAYGLFNFYIGGGEPLSGSFADIDWGADQTWLELEIDAGDGLESTGAMKFVSVPYALHAETVTDKDDADADPTNELISDVSISGNGSTLLIIEAGITHEVVLPSGSGGGNPTDELITDFSLASDGNTIVLTEAGVTRTVQLPTDNYIDDDADPDNELITSWVETPTHYTFVEGGNAYSIAKQDADFIVGNEYVNSLSVVAGNLTLTQVGGGSTLEVPLADINLPDGDTDPTNELQTLAQVLAEGNNASGTRITNLGTPTAAADATTKNYVDYLNMEGDVLGNPTTMKVVGIQGVNVANTTPADGMVLKYNAAQTRWEPAADAVASGPSGVGFISVSPMDFIGLRDAGDEDKYNIAVHEFDRKFVTILKKDHGDRIGAPIHFPHGVVMDNIKVMYKVRIPGASRSLEITIERHNIAAGTTDELLQIDYSATIINNTLRSSTIDLSVLPIDEKTINNELYSYHIIARFDTPSDFNDLAGADIQLHGAVIRYNQ